MGQIQFVTSLVLISLFVFALGTFAVNFAEENSASVSLADDKAFNQVKGINGTIETFYDETNGSSTSFFKSSVEAGSETTATGGQFKVGPGNALTATKNAIDSAFGSIFGEDKGNFGVFFTALVAILTSVLFLYIWKTWKGGTPD